jgi:HKD family nuclease
MLTDAEATQAVRRLVGECTQFYAAVAWAGSNPVVAAMLKHSSKIRQVVIGTHMYQTRPDVLRAFMPYAGARCMPPNGRLFHPKIYLFQMERTMAAVVGSHNLTGGAFGGTNIEVSVLLEAESTDSDAQVFDDLTHFIQRSWNSARAIDEERFLFAYEAQYRMNRAKREDLDQFSEFPPPAGGQADSSLDISWSDFVNGVKADPHHGLAGRLAVLEGARRLLQRDAFAALAPSERKAVAGTYGKKEPKLDDLDWAWFGTMFGQGDFKSLVNKRPNGLSAALDHIPAEGPVTEKDYRAFVADFEKAFRGKDHKGGVPTASRLLLMKRPDWFVGWNQANRVGLKRAFLAPRTAITFDSYWEKLIVPMHTSTWWLHPRPRNELQGRIWDNRAALLDCIYYDPKTKKRSTVP